MALFKSTQPFNAIDMNKYLCKKSNEKTNLKVKSAKRKNPLQSSIDTYVSDKMAWGFINFFTLVKTMFTLERILYASSSNPSIKIITISSLWWEWLTIKLSRGTSLSLSPSLQLFLTSLLIIYFSWPVTALKHLG